MSSKGKDLNQMEYSGRDNLEVMKEAKKYNHFLLKLISGSARNGEVIVDFGAGAGTFSFPLAKKGAKVICVETDPVLSNSLIKHGLEVVNSLDFIEDNSIDYIYTLNVLEHIEDDEAIIKLWFNKLKPGGTLLIYVPAFQILYTSMDKKVGHFRRYTRQQLDRKLKRAEFKVNDIRYADSIGYLATLIYKILDNGDGGLNSGLLKIYDRWIFPISLIVDLLTHSFVGKNVYAIAVKPTGAK